ncbi:MAG TPA: N-acetylmuramoyl-L-alanine amidase [Deltaproteobacteria bacterium]|nr:N-acetylmuramoyl-L-alanine amidase [Deltaproteobacteria bacterium]
MWLSLLLACTSAPSILQGLGSGAPDPRWPEAGAPLHHPVLEVPEGFGRYGVFVVAGHGTGSNVGNLGCRCIQEEHFTLEAASDLAARLEITGLFEIIEARSDTARPSYPARLRHLARSGADVLIELHSDARGARVAEASGSVGDEICRCTDVDPGLSVLVSDEGGEALDAARLALARHVADALGRAGFPLYDGGRYGAQYERDTTEGVFLDRRGLMMLRRPKVPSIIIETHNALDPQEADRWEEPRTRDAFARAVLGALIAYFSEERS